MPTLSDSAETILRGFAAWYPSCRAGFGLLLESYLKEVRMHGSANMRPLNEHEQARVIQDCRQWSNRVVTVVRGMARVIAMDHPPIAERIMLLVEDLQHLADDYKTAMGWDQKEKVERRIGNE
jgi:hypothetical protein